MYGGISFKCSSVQHKHKLLCHLQVFHVVFSFFACVYRSQIWLSIWLFKRSKYLYKSFVFLSIKVQILLGHSFPCVLKIELNKQEWKWFCHKQRLLHWLWLVTLLHYMVGFYTWMLLVHFRGTWSSIKLFFLLWYINKLNGLKVW